MHYIFNNDLIITKKKKKCFIFSIEQSVVDSVAETIISHLSDLFSPSEVERSAASVKLSNVLALDNQLTGFFLSKLESFLKPYELSFRICFCYDSS